MQNAAVRSTLQSPQELLGVNIFPALASVQFSQRQLFRLTDQEQTDLLAANSSLIVQLDKRFDDTVGLFDLELKLGDPLVGGAEALGLEVISAEAHH